MRIECIACCCCLTGRSKKFRQYAAVQGWVWFLVGTDLYWKCGTCAAQRTRRTNRQGAE